MKDSGVEWLGEVPEHWEVPKLGQIGSFFKGRGGTKADEIADGVPCVRYGDLYTRHRFFVTDTRACVSAEAAAERYTSIRYGDVLFAGSGETLGEIGKSAVNLLSDRTCCGGDVIVFRPSIAAHARFLGYAAGCPAAISQKARLGRGLTVMHVYSIDLKYLSVAMPPLSEQRAIVRFLDHADRRIQRYIRAKERLIELLEEQKQAIIHQAVTGQIDVQTGRPYAAYKAASVEWLGEVPEDWERRRSKQVFTPRRELARPDDVQLSATQAFGVIAQKDYEARIGRKIVKIFKHLEKRRHVEVDDFVISMRSFQGGLERAWASGCIRSSYVVLQSATSLSVNYFGYLFKSVGYIRALQSTANFIRDGQDLNFGDFCRVDLPFPPIETQRRIAKFLGNITADIATTVDRYRCQIDLLQEYRTRLIADVVTGKLDVRQADASLGELDPLSTDESRNESEPSFDEYQEAEQPALQPSHP